MNTNPNTGRCSMLAVVGGYLLYLAYELGRDMANGVPTTMAPALTIIVIVLFGLIGLGLLFFAFRLWKQGKLEDEKNRVLVDEEQPDDPKPPEDDTDISAS